MTTSKQSHIHGKFLLVEMSYTGSEPEGGYVTFRCDSLKGLAQMGVFLKRCLKLEIGQKQVLSLDGSVISQLDQLYKEKQTYWNFARSIEIAVVSHTESGAVEMFPGERVLRISSTKDGLAYLLERFESLDDVRYDYEVFCRSPNIPLPLGLRISAESTLAQAVFIYAYQEEDGFYDYRFMRKISNDD